MFELVMRGWRKKFALFKHPAEESESLQKELEFYNVVVALHCETNKHVKQKCCEAKVLC